MNRLVKLCFFLLVCGGVLSARPFPAHAGPLDPYIQAAQKEAAVRIGVTLRNKVSGKPAGELYMAAFQKRYPFLKVEFKRIGGAQERERVTTEMSAGMFNYDVVTVGTPMIPTVVSAKLPRVVEWEKLGVPKFLIHPDNIGISLRTPVFGIAYNRDLVPDTVAETFTWETCTDPKWKGKGAVDDRPRHLAEFYPDEVWGRGKTLDYAKRWAANNLAVESSRSTASAKLMSGAYHIICGMPRRQIKDLQVYAGAKSVGIVFPEPVPVGVGDFVYVPDKARHAAAGVVFLVWSSSHEAQDLLDQVDFSGHPNFEGNEVNRVLKGKKVAYGTWGAIDGQEQILVETLQAMGMPVVRSQRKKK
ncbi:MAG: extracellular solute-binding protein [Desulfobacterales bacterium]|nr:extracellular solute-binding protein [Desulfobacterales bacterium]